MRPENLGVIELSAAEMREIDGGIWNLLVLAAGVAVGYGIAYLIDSQ